MNDKFFEWLSECPAQWVLHGIDSEDNRTYEFYNNEVEEEETKEEFKCVECGNIDFEFKDFSNKTIKICNQCKTEQYEQE